MARDIDSTPQMTLIARRTVSKLPFPATARLARIAIPALSFTNLYYYQQLQLVLIRSITGNGSDNRPVVSD